MEMTELNVKLDKMFESIKKMQELNQSQSKAMESLGELSLKNQKSVNDNTESIKLLTDMVKQNNDAITDIVQHIKTIYESLPQ